MTFVGQDEVRTGGSGWQGRTGRIPAVKVVEVMAMDVWGLGTSTFGLMHVEGGVADIGTGCDFVWDAFTGVDEDMVDDTTVDEVCNGLTCDWGAGRQTDGVVLAGDTAHFDWIDLRPRLTAGVDDVGFPAKLEVEQLGTGWVLDVAATHVTTPANCACCVEACVAIGDDTNQSCMWLTLIGKVFDFTSTVNKIQVQFITILVSLLSSSSSSSALLCSV